MTRRLSVFTIALAAALGLFANTAAEASSILMCRPPAPGTSPGPGRITMQGTGNVYQLDRWGCAQITATDVGEATANGLAQTGSLRALQLTGITAQTLVGTLPASAIIREIVVQNSSGNTVTSGVKFGTTAGGTDVVSGMLASSNSVQLASDVSLAKRIFSSNATQAIWIDAVGAWNSATVSVTILYGFF